MSNSKITRQAEAINAFKIYFHIMNKMSFTPFPRLITERLILRQPVYEDAEEIFQLRSNETVNKYLDRPKANSIADAVQFLEKIKSIIADKQGLYWIATLKDESNVAGSISLWNFSEETGCAEIGYELLPSFQGKGFMQEALNAVIGFAFKNAGLKKLQAFTHPENISSSKLLQKSNFRRDAQAEQEYFAKGELWGMIIYSLVNSGE